MARRRPTTPTRPLIELDGNGIERRQSGSVQGTSSTVKGIAVYGYNDRQIVLDTADDLTR